MIYREALLRFSCSIKIIYTKPVFASSTATREPQKLVPRFRGFTDGQPPIFVPKKGFPDANLRALGVPVEGVPRRELESVGGSRRNTGFYSFFFILYYLSRAINGRPYDYLMVSNFSTLVLPDVPPAMPPVMTIMSPGAASPKFFALCVAL